MPQLQAALCRHDRPHSLGHIGWSRLNLPDLEPGVELEAGTLAALLDLQFKKTFRISTAAIVKLEQ